MTEKEEESEEKFSERFKKERGLNVEAVASSMDPRDIEFATRQMQDVLSLADEVSVVSLDRKDGKKFSRICTNIALTRSLSEDRSK